MYRLGKETNCIATSASHPHVHDLRTTLIRVWVEISVEVINMGQIDFLFKVELPG